MNKENFFERFTIDVKNGRLGGGSFGTVYKAYDNLSDQLKAIKVAEVKYINNKEFSLITEFNAVSKLGLHKNIANYEAVFQFQMENGIFDYAVMQYYPEGNLKQLLTSRKLGVNQKVAIVNGLLSGISFLHQNKIIHRDLKPGNILISKDINGQYIPKIADFGLSKILDNEEFSAHSNSFQGGSLDYCSPEQLFGLPLKFNSDLWSFGVISYEIFTGKKPFDSDALNVSPEAKRTIIYQKIISASIDDIIENCPFPYDELVKFCLEKDPGIRVDDALVLIEYLKNPEKIITPKDDFEEVDTELISSESEKIKNNPFESIKNFIPGFLSSKIDEVNLSNEKQRQLKEEERQKKLEQERLRKEEEERQRKLEQEKLRKEEEERQRKLEQEKLRKEEEERQRKLEEERLRKEEEEKQRKLEEERLRKEEEERQRKLEQEKLRKEEEERQRKLEEERLRKEEEERQRKLEEERLRKEEEERQRKLEEERLRKEEEERQRKLEEERLRKEEEERQRKLEEERLRKEEERQRKLEEERLRKEEEERQRKLEQERLRKEEEERQRKLEQERLRKEEEERQRKLEQERLRKEEEEKQRKLEQEKLRKEEEERQKKLKEERQRKEEEERQIKLEQERLRKEEERQQKIFEAEQKKEKEKQQKLLKEKQKLEEKDKKIKEKELARLNAKGDDKSISIVLRKYKYLILGIAAVVTVGIASLLFIFKRGSDFIPYKQDNLWGYKNKSGDAITPPVFDSIFNSENETWFGIKNDSVYVVNIDGSLKFKEISKTSAITPGKDISKLLTMDMIENAKTIEDLNNLKKENPNNDLIKFIDEKILKLEAINEENLYKEAMASSDLKVLENYLKLHPKGKYVKDISKKIKSVMESMSLKSEEEYFNNAIKLNSLSLLSEYKKKYPKGKYLAEVDKKIREINFKTEKDDWTRTLQANTMDAYKDFLKKYPESQFQGQASAKMENLKNEEIKIYWNIVKSSRDIDKINEFIGIYPKSQFVDDARDLIKDINLEIENNDRKNALNSKNVDVLNRFLRKYPNSRYRSEINAAIDELSKTLADDDEIKNLMAKIPSVYQDRNDQEKYNNIKNRIASASLSDTKTKQSIVKEINELSEGQKKKEVPIPDIISNIEKDFVTIGSANYQLGCPGNNCVTADNKSEKKYIKAFAISRYEVTQALYKSVTGKNPSYYNDCNTCPVENITYGEALDFINKLNNMPGNPYEYRLPTEYEWEYAASGGNSNIYSGSNDANAVAVYGEKNGTDKVGLRKSNSFGLKDMSGNVAEFTSDWYDGADAGKNTYKISKGGSWRNNANSCKITERSRITTGSKNEFTGFRLVRSLK